MLDEFMHEAQRCTTAKPRLEFAMSRVAEYQPAQPITTMMCRPRNQRCCPARIDRLETALRCEMHSGAQVQCNQHRALAFLAKQLCVRGRTARGNAPVDAARVIARLVGPRFVEFHAAPAEPRNVSTGLQRVHAQHVKRDRARRATEPDQASLADADRGRAFMDVFETNHLVYGTPTPSRMPLMTVSGSTPSASASKLSTRRWRNTSCATA